MSGIWRGIRFAFIGREGDTIAHMGTDAVADYQRLGDQLAEAAETLKSSKKKASRRNPPIAGTMTGNPDHPAEPLPPKAVAELGMANIEVVHSVNVSSGVTEIPTVVPDEGPVSESLDAVALADGEVEAAAEDVPSSKAAELAKLVDLASLEALLFTTRHPLTPSRVGELIDVPSSKALRAGIAELNRQYEAAGRSFRIEQVAGGYQMLTLPVYGPLLNKLYQRDIDSKLTRSALETLSIIAYKQPVLRAEVEAIRGVASGETIRSLMEKHLVKIAGRAEEPGRPILYGTTKRFLELFGLNSLKELPKDPPAGAKQAPAAAVEQPVAQE